MPKLLKMHLWGLYGNTYATYLVTAFNHVIKAHSTWTTQDYNNDNDETFQCHRLPTASGQISQKSFIVCMEKSVYPTSMACYGIVSDSWKLYKGSTALLINDAQNVYTITWMQFG